MHGTTWYPEKTIRLHRNLDEAVAGINTLAFTALVKETINLDLLKVNLKLVV